MLWVPIPPPPVWLAIAKIAVAVFGAIGGLFGLFGGGVPSAVKSALDSLRGALRQTAEALMRFAWQIARAFGWLLQAVQRFWVRVIRPLLAQLPRVIGRLRRLIERDLPRLLRWIDKIRERLLEIYEKWMRPLLLVIQRMRRMLLIFRLLGFKWAERADRRLTELQGRVMQPLMIALGHIGAIEQWLNVIVTYDQLIQETIWHNSVWHYQEPIVRAWANMMFPPADPAAEATMWPARGAVTAEESQAALVQYLRTGSGPIAADVQHAVSELRGQLGA